MNRMSVLPIAELCPTAAELSERFGSGRAAAMGRAHHAYCHDPKSHETKVAFAGLTEAEQEQVKTWKVPTDVTLPDGHVLRYATAQKELTVALDEQCEYVDVCPKCLGKGRHMMGQGNVACLECMGRGPSALTVGHIDMGWVWRDTAYVGDIKKSEWTTANGPLSLQLQSYGLAFARKTGCDYFVTGIFGAIEGAWDWSAPVDVSWQSEELPGLESRIVHAATNRGGEACLGPHCRDCFARHHCPDQLLPGAGLAAAAEGALAPYTTPGGITKDNAAELLARYQAAKDLLGNVKSALEAWAAQNGGIEAGDKVWREVMSQGKSKTEIDTRQLELDHPELCQKYYSTYKTKPRSMGFRWTNKR